MTGAQALDLIMARLNRRTNTTIRASALLEMILFQQMLEKDAVLPDFLYTYDQTIALTAANRRFTLPADFLREDDEDESLWILDDSSEYQPMERVGFDDTQYTRTATGSLPQKYAIRGLYGYTFPIPTVDRTLKMNYFSTGATITDDTIETVWLKHAPDLLIGGTGLVINALYVKDPDAAAFFGSMEQRGRGRFLTEQTARAEAGRSRRMG